MVGASDPRTVSVATVRLGPGEHELGLVIEVEVTHDRMPWRIRLDPDSAAVIDVQARAYD